MNGKKSIIVKASVKVLQSQKCMVLNYNRRPKVWEEGIVSAVRIGVNREGICHVSYDVILDRVSISAREKRREYPIPTRLSVTVGDDAIKPL